MMVSNESKLLSEEREHDMAEQAEITCSYSTGCKSKTELYPTGDGLRTTDKTWKYVSDRRGGRWICGLHDEYLSQYERVWHNEQEV